MAGPPVSVDGAALSIEVVWENQLTLVDSMQAIRDAENVGVRKHLCVESRAPLGLTHSLSQLARPDIQLQKDLKIK